MVIVSRLLFDIYIKTIDFIVVFEELPSTDNASGPRSGATSGPSSAGTTPLEALQRTDSQYSQESQPRGSLGRRERVLVASRHLRNDSKTIQLECAAPAPAARDLSLDQLKQLALKSMEGLELPACKRDDETKRLLEAGGVLRHRRTGSRDLKPPAGRHKRTSSHHITMEPHELSLQLQKGRSVDQLAAPSV